MDRLIRIYKVVLVITTVLVFGACLLSIESAAHLVVFAIPLVLLVFFAVLNVEFTPDAESRGELECLVGMKRGGVLLRHAAHIGPRWTRTMTPSDPSSPTDSSLDRLVRAKRALPADQGSCGIRRRV